MAKLLGRQEKGLSCWPTEHIRAPEGTTLATALVRKFLFIPHTSHPTSFSTDSKRTKKEQTGCGSDKFLHSPTTFPEHLVLASNWSCPKEGGDWFIVILVTSQKLAGKASGASTST